MKPTKDDVTAFRLRAHHLDRRTDRNGLPAAAGRCGIQDSPPGSAGTALHARVRDLTREGLDDAIARDKSLLRSWCMRGAPFCVPTADAPVFTTGVLPPDEAALRRFLPGAGPAVDRLGLGLTEAADLTAAEIEDVLAGRRLAISELGAEVAARIAPRLPKKRRAIWQEEGPYAAGQPLGEAVVHFCVRVLTLRGVLCFASRDGAATPFILVGEWLGEPFPDIGPERARAELLRRYLRCYGPSTRADFAAWLGVRAGDTGPWWGAVEDEMAPVGFGGRTAWMLAEDLDALGSVPDPTGVRLLPPGDPYTHMRDRATIVDPAYHRAVWKTVGSPGTVLVDGRITGVWRARTSGRSGAGGTSGARDTNDPGGTSGPGRTRGRKVTIRVTAFGPMRERDRKALRAEAEGVAALRGASSVAVEFDTQ
ncbi:winged helix DNA-binding domain-containing protein [Streptomyces sp. NPDC046203]|uniref:winged helix DNA-binding domain-containing protein n=1 Tax=Streptomyces sp. NPDC046203 TaxID=3154602 RepID=UPI00340F8667